MSKPFLWLRAKYILTNIHYVADVYVERIPIVFNDIMKSELKGNIETSVFSV